MREKSLHMNISHSLNENTLKYNSNNLSLGSFHQLYYRVDTVSGEMFGRHGVSNMNRLHADVFQLFPYEFEECSINSFGSIGDF